MPLTHNPRLPITERFINLINAADEAFTNLKAVLDTLEAMNHRIAMGEATWQQAWDETYPTLRDRFMPVSLFAQMECVLTERAHFRANARRNERERERDARRRSGTAVAEVYGRGHVATYDSHGYVPGDYPWQCRRCVAQGRSRVYEGRFTVCEEGHNRQDVEISLEDLDVLDGTAPPPSIGDAVDLDL